MLHYNTDDNESAGYLNELYTLLINILIQEDESYDSNQEGKMDKKKDH